VKIRVTQRQVFYIVHTPQAAVFASAPVFTIISAKTVCYI